MFAKIGMPLQDMKQLYQFMDPVLKGQFRGLITSDDAQTCNLKDPLATFKVIYGVFCFTVAVVVS